MREKNNILSNKSGYPKYCAKPIETFSLIVGFGNKSLIFLKVIAKNNKNIKDEEMTENIKRNLL